MTWLILFVAICAEVMATTAMKLTDGFKKIWPWAFVMAGCFGLALYLLSLTLDTLPVGPVYAIWSGSGVALITIVGQVVFKQVMDRPALIGIVLIVAGVVVLQVFSAAVPR
ncbi:multidrug efflux SMR transporter [Accumulibacter sp.]|uniref:Small multidrug resistance protein n=1 Tax=Accumulibacter regalis TaxID=522306 RepID=C7RU42_ACCRE|nr:multidrug efflux SMR transporter [Accumulibacter sp.]MBN8496151.1 multidrug efflux SMR transporter [Accumulibacter sp.]MBO3716177.1 multidrug efflux SMR transporter [Accumulibacter sp.]